MSPWFHGLVLLNKPIGLSSNGALGRAKFLLKNKKAGHTGSLDPLATGMLPLCFGEATKFSQFLLEASKTYLVTATLGARTNTGDSEGVVISGAPLANLNANEILASLNQFLGKQSQIPPMFSALKHKGQPLYKLARQGIEIERAPRDIEIYAIQLLDLSLEATTGWVSFSVSCSKGTYVRTLVDDLGQLLGCGAHVSALHRESVGPFKAQQMYSLEALQDLIERDAIFDAIMPIEAALLHWPEVEVSASSCFYLKQGQPVRVPDTVTDWVRIKSQDGVFLGMGQMLGDGRLAPRRLLQTTGL